MSIPEAEDFDHFVAQDGRINHTCVLEVAITGMEIEAAMKDFTCQLVVKTFKGRILPNCNAERGIIISWICA